MYLPYIASGIRLQVVAGRSSLVAAMHAPPTARGATGEARIEYSFHYSWVVVIRGQSPLSFWLLKTLLAFFGVAVS
jgi:hypothetical protein